MWAVGWLTVGEGVSAESVEVGVKSLVTRWRHPADAIRPGRGWVSALLPKGCCQATSAAAKALKPLEHTSLSTPSLFGLASQLSCENLCFNCLVSTICRDAIWLRMVQIIGRNTRVVCCGAHRNVLSAMHGLSPHFQSNGAFTGSAADCVTRYQKSYLSVDGDFCRQNWNLAAATIAGQFLAALNRDSPRWGS